MALAWGGHLCFLRNFAALFGTVDLQGQAGETAIACEGERVPVSAPLGSRHFDLGEMY